MVNGQLEGFFFPGKQGLWQGDPISPLLFVLCMEYFTRRINKDAAQDFTYHKYCLEMKLNHRCFADDLFVFSNGDAESIKVIQYTIQHIKAYMAFIPI